jgi:hypothetical protein
MHPDTGEKAIVAGVLPHHQGGDPPPDEGFVSYLGGSSTSNTISASFRMNEVIHELPGSLTSDPQVRCALASTCFDHCRLPLIINLIYCYF